MLKKKSMNFTTHYYQFRLYYATPLVFATNNRYGKTSHKSRIEKHKWNSVQLSVRSYTCRDTSAQKKNHRYFLFLRNKNRIKWKKCKTFEILGFWGKNSARNITALRKIVYTVLITFADLCPRYIYKTITLTVTLAATIFFSRGKHLGCFAPAARPKHYRPVRYLCHAPRATGTVINKLRAVCGRAYSSDLLRVSVFYVRSLPSTRTAASSPPSSSAVSEKLSERHVRAQNTCNYLYARKDDNLISRGVHFKRPIYHGNNLLRNKGDARRGDCTAFSCAS